jgi:hypothetical protein
MDESQQEVIQAEVPEVPAPELEATAAPEPEVTDAPEEKPVEQAAKVFTQEELDAAIGKRLAREQRKWEREQRLKAEETKLKANVPAELPPADSLPPEEYAELLAEKRAVELIERREQARIQAELVEQYHEREEEARSKYDDFEQVAYNPKLPITDVMAQTIQASDIGPEMAYYLGSNPKEAERISKLSPFMQAKEIGKIEAKLSDNPPVKKTSNAPAPIAPVTARTSSSPAFDTTDPRSIKSMSTSEWIEAERQRQIKKLEAMRNR